VYKTRNIAQRQSIWLNTEDSHLCLRVRYSNQDMLRWQSTLQGVTASRFIAYTVYKRTGSYKTVRHCIMWDRGSTVVKVLCYKSEGRWFDPRFRSHYGPGAFPGSKGGRCVRLTTLPPSCAVFMKSGNLNFLEPSGPLQNCNGTVLLYYVSFSWLGSFIIIIYRNWVVTWWQWLIYMYTKHEIGYY